MSKHRNYTDGVLIKLKYAGRRKKGTGLSHVIKLYILSTEQFFRRIFQCQLAPTSHV